MLLAAWIPDCRSARFSTMWEDHLQLLSDTPRFAKSSHPAHQQAPGILWQLRLTCKITPISTSHMQAAFVLCGSACLRTVLVRHRSTEESVVPSQHFTKGHPLGPFVNFGLRLLSMKSVILNKRGRWPISTCFEVGHCYASEAETCLPCKGLLAEAMRGLTPL